MANKNEFIKLYCFGCGALLQNNNPDKPGFVPKQLEKNSKYMCQRCFRLQHYGITNEEITDFTNYDKIITKAKKERSLIIYVVDLFAFECSINHTLLDKLKDARVVVVASKRDVIPSSIKDEKLKQFIAHRFDELGIKYTKQKKYLIEMTETLEDKLKENNNIVIDLKQVYLKTDKNYEMRLRTRSLDGLDSYFVSIKKDYKRKESIITNQRIDKKEYERLLKQRKIKNIVEKKRICFTYKEHIYKLDIFDNNTYLLETDEKVKIPSFIKVIKDVSTDKKYKNRNM